LPRGQATLHTLRGAELPDVMLLLGWRDVPDNLLPALGYTTSIVDVLSLAEDMLQRHRDALPARAVKRHRERPAVVAFVRRLNSEFVHRGKRLSAKTLAAWAEAAVGEVLTPRDVRVILPKRGS
jgi:hypothetical protein